jgi:hypothetical protein
MKMLGSPSQDAQPASANPTTSAIERPVSAVESQARYARSPRASVPAPFFRKAIKRDAKLRLAVCGPSGSGKTYTLLNVATEVGGPIAVVDTEHGSASKYADIFDFDVLELDSYDPARLIAIIDDVVKKGYRVLCVDSLSHFWIGKDGELDKVDRAARRMHTPNSFAAWKEVTPLHNALIDKIVSSPLHILASMRAKTEWVIDRDERTGKTAPRKVGLAPVMRDGIEYEFDVCGDMDQENTLVITKTRCPKLAGGVFTKPGKELAELLKEWLGGVGVAVIQSEASNDSPMMHTEPKKASVLNITDELAGIWKKMCTPRGVIEEFDQLRLAIERLAGSEGVVEYFRLLRQHGVDRRRQFKSMQPARLCAKDVYLLLEQLRANARANQCTFEIEMNGVPISSESKI